MQNIDWSAVINNFVEAWYALRQTGVMADLAYWMLRCCADLNDVLKEYVPIFLA